MRLFPPREDIRIVDPVRFYGLIIGAEPGPLQRGCFDRNNRCGEYSSSKIALYGEPRALKAVNQAAAACHDGNSNNDENNKAKGASGCTAATGKLKKHKCAEREQ